MTASKRACPHTDALIHRDNSLLGLAPVLVATCWPPLKTISVGIEPDALTCGDGGVLIDIELSDFHFAVHFVRRFLPARERSFCRGRTIPPRNRR